MALIVARSPSELVGALAYMLRVCRPTVNHIHYDRGETIQEKQGLVPPLGPAEIRPADWTIDAPLVEHLRVKFIPPGSEYTPVRYTLEVAMLRLLGDEPTPVRRLTAEQDLPIPPAKLSQEKDAFYALHSPIAELAFPGHQNVANQCLIHTPVASQIDGVVIHRTPVAFRFMADHYDPLNRVFERKIRAMALSRGLK